MVPCSTSRAMFMPLFTSAKNAGSTRWTMGISMAAAAATRTVSASWTTMAAGPLFRIISL